MGDQLTWHIRFASACWTFLRAAIGHVFGKKQFTLGLDDVKFGAGACSLFEVAEGAIVPVAVASPTNNSGDWAIFL